MAHTQGASIAQASLPQPARHCAAGDLADDRLVHMVENWEFVIKRLRIVYGLTQEHVGIMFGVSQRTVSRWERSEAKPSPRCRRRLRNLGLEVSEVPSDSLVASARPPPGSDGLPGTHNFPQKTLPGKNNALVAGQPPRAIADSVIAFLGYLSREDIEQLPVRERRRLADQCRNVAQLAEPRDEAQD